ncbi:hypothetical protein [Floccifex sp.]|uniref:hypothetical protein n=1 Tax=Floccifex sp. TaxID=2815810 RepID=UPI003F0989AD
MIQNTHETKCTFTTFFDKYNTRDYQVLFMGSLNCLRHKPFAKIGRIMQNGQGALLCPSMSDFSTGRYLNQIKEAILELYEERHYTKYLLVVGCQWMILSSDGTFLIQELKEEYGITLEIVDDNHIEKEDRKEH